jgi:aspartate dehydrogenase
MGALRVGIIGCGAIGSSVAKAIGEGKAGDAKVAAVLDIDTAKAKGLASKTGSKISKGVASLVSASDVVVECASQGAVRELAPKIAGKKDLVVLSVGALLDEQLLALLIRKAKRGRTKLYAPSGAVCGLDGLKGAGMGRIESVDLITTKSPKSLGLEAKEKTVVFIGTPEEAVKKFPANINVSAAVKLSARGAPVTVRIVADPKAKANTHEVSARGEFGALVCKVENVPSKDNPKTSALAAMSAVALLRRLGDTLIVGT